MSRLELASLDCGLSSQYKQSGAAEARWAHNPEGDGSKPSSAISLLPRGDFRGRKKHLFLNLLAFRISPGYNYDHSYNY